MKALTIDLEHCYGIRRLTAKLDFSKTNAIAIYAPNGSMKTSLAHTFQDIAGGTASKDRIFPARVCTRNVKDETGAELPKDSVLVVRPYEEAMGHTAKTSTLLVNPALRKEYEELHAAIDAAKAALIKALREQSGSKRDIEKEFSLAFTANDNKFYIALNRIKDEVANRPDAPLKDVPYDLIFDEKVQSCASSKSSSRRSAPPATRSPRSASILQPRCATCRNGWGKPPRTRTARHSSPRSPRSRPARRRWIAKRRSSTTASRTPRRDTCT